MSITVPHADNHMKGGLLVVASTVFFALSGIFTKSIDHNAWTILGWRGFIGGLLVMLYVLYGQRRACRPISLRLGREGWVVALTSAISGALFVSAFKYTSVANVVVIYATVPFLAAGLAWLWFRERVKSGTLIAAGVSLAGVAVTISGNAGGGNLGGDLLAIGMAIGCAAYLVMIRLYRDAPAVWASGVAALILIIPALLWGDFTAIGQRDALLMTLFGCSFAAAIISWTEGARLIPAGEAGLLGSAEIPIAAVFAAILLGEYPSVATVLGGAIVLAALVWHSLREARRA